MNNLFSLKQIKFILYTAGSLLIVYLGIILFFKKPNPQIKLTSPVDSSQKVAIYTDINYVFDQDVLVQDLSFQITPEVPLTNKQVKPDSITLTPKRTLQPSTTYTITLYWQDKQIHVLTFTTQATQTDPILIENMKTELARDYPLGQKLPLDNSQYRVVYSAPMTLEITIKNPNLTSKEIIDEVKSWVTQNGGDASAHKYVVAP